MSYENAQRQQVGMKQGGVFSGGMVDNTPNLYLQENFSPYIRNARLEGQSTIIRPGHSLFKNLEAGDYPRGIGSYLRASSSNDVMVVRHNIDSTHKLYTLTESGTLTSVSTSTDIASDNRMSFTNIGDVIYCMNGSDKFGKLSGTTYTTPNTGVSNFAPSFSVVFNSSHWASGWSTNSNKVYKSVANQYEDFNSSGADSFLFEENITGLSANLQAIFYFTRNTISVTGLTDLTDNGTTVSYTNRKLEVKEGAVNHASIVEVGNIVYFLTPSNKINTITVGQNVNGFEVIELTDRKYKGISQFMGTLDKDQSDSFGYYIPETNLIKWFLKTEGATFNDVCIVYNVEVDTFTIDTNKYFYDGISFKGNNYTLSTLEPKVYLDEYGQDDEDSAIPFDFYTKEFYISDPTFKKIFWETRTLLDINELAELYQYIYIDGNLVDTKRVDIDNIPVSTGGIGIDEIATTPIGTATEGEEYNEIYILRTKGNLNLKGRKIQFRFTNDSLAGKVRLKSLAVKSEILPDLANNLTT